MKIAAVIPARYGSTRFPGKPLAIIKGKSMIRRVYEQCLKAKKLDRVMVATDDVRIFTEVEGFGGDVVMTSDKHASGTERIAEAVSGAKFNVVINVQGDEPFIYPGNIDLLAEAMTKQRDVHVATLAVAFRNRTEVEDVNKVKVITDNEGNALYFSRSVIPNDLSGKFKFKKHLGIYAYRSGILNEFPKLKKTPLEKAERLEQLRFLENGIKIKVINTNRDSIAVDTPEDLERVIGHA